MQPSCAYGVQYGCDDSFESDVFYFCVKLQGQIVQRLNLKNQEERSLCDKSMKFGGDMQ